MAVNIEKQTMSLNKIVSRDTQIIWIEQDILVPDVKPDVMKIVQVEAIPYINSAEAVEGGIRTTGEITYYVVYRAMDNKTRGISMTYPFSQTINVPDSKENMNIRMDAKVRNIIYSLPNERKVSIKTEVVFKYVIGEKQDLELIHNMKSDDDIETKMAQDTFYNVLDVKQEILDAKEDIVVPESTPQIGEILRVSSKISNTDYKVSYNKILVKGDINVEILYVENGDKDDIFTYNTVVPFTGMIEFSNIAESSRFDIKYTMRNLEIVLGDNGMITISAEVIANAIMFEEKKVDYVNDFYSISNNLHYDKSDVVVIKNKESIKKQITLKENIGITDEKNKVISSKVRLEHLNYKVSGGNLYIDGPIKVEVMFVNKDTNTLDNKTYDLLVDSTIQLGKDIDEKNIDINVDVMNQMISVQNGNVEANITLNVDITIENIDKISIIGQIDEDSFDQNTFDSMYIYIVKKGDTLWNIAKNYKTTVSKIVNTNNIVDENKIDIGQKLLIIR